MRILIATQHSQIIGGVETYLRTLLQLLENAGMQIAMLTESVCSSNGRMVATSNTSILQCGESIPEKIAGLEKWMPDVVFCQGLHDERLEAAISSRFPTVLFAHNYSGTCVSGTKCHMRPHPAPCQRTLGLGCLTAYFPRRCGGRNPLTLLRLFRNERRRNRNLSQYQAILVASRHMADEFRRHGVARDRLKIVPYFTPDSAPDLAPPSAKPLTNRILFAGRLTALKGWRQLLDALPAASAELDRNLRLVVAGDGPDRAPFEAEARRRGLQSEFLGWVSSERRNAEMRNADLLVVPSIWPEPFGLVGIEAGCVGLPAVAFSVGGIPDWLVPGVSGELAPGERPCARDLAAAIVRALQDDGHRHKLGVGAWETSRKFTPEAHLDKLIPILEAATR